MTQIIYAMLVAAAAYGITDFLFRTTWLSVLAALLALLVFFLRFAFKFMISFITIGVFSLFGEKKSLKEISAEAMGNAMEDDLMDFDGDDDD